MTCEKCIHYDVCNIFFNADRSVFRHFVVTHCNNFKDKSKFIELPCRVGDLIIALWDVPTPSKYVPYWAEVKEFKQSKRNGEVVCTVIVEPIEYRGRRKEYRVDEFGKLLFFSYDEAEKALLKERENHVCT